LLYTIQFLFILAYIKKETKEELKKKLKKYNNKIKNKKSFKSRSIKTLGLKSAQIIASFRRTQSLVDKLISIDSICEQANIRTFVYHLA